MNADVEQLPIFARVATGLRPVLLLAGIAAAVAAGLGIVFWAKGPSYSLLYSSLAAGDLVEVQQTLQAAGIEHTADVERGTVSVPAQRLNDARLALAAQGVLQSTDGFSAMAKDSGFGVSQFMEGARYQHALETELARTIARLQPGVLGDAQSHEQDSFSAGLLDCPHYSRPENWRAPDGDRPVPPVLLSGHHADIALWRREQSLLLTARRRPDLITAARAAGALSAADEKFLAALKL